MNEVSLSEEARVKGLLSYNVLDTLPEEDFEAITKLASHICDTPISLVSFVDDHRQWFKSNRGLTVTETSKDIAFCSHAIQTPEKPMVVPDARNDSRFKNNPLVTGEPHIVFYAGFPLNSSEGHALGTLCIIDTKPRQLSADQVDSMHALSVQVIRLLDLRKRTHLLEAKSVELTDANIQLNQFAKLAAHDIKGPLVNINMSSNLLLHDFEQGDNSNSLSYINMISKSSKRLCSMIDSLLLFYTNEGVEKDKKVDVSLSLLVKHLREMLCLDSGISVDLSAQQNEIYVNELVLKQVLLNLVSNAVKYNDKVVDEIEIKISVSPMGDNKTMFSVADNGIGIEPKYLDSIFKIFTTGAAQDRYGEKGTGIGLAAVKKLVESQGGKIEVESEVGVGSVFSFTL